MSLEMVVGYRPDEEQKRPVESISWDSMSHPLKLELADQGGAMFRDEASGEAWYLDLGEMVFRLLTAEDVHESRLGYYQTLDLAAAVYANGTEAAMEVRAKMLEKELQSFKRVNHKVADLVVEAFEEELGLVHAYLKETDEVERGRLRNDLNEMYAEMREPERNIDVKKAA